MVRDGEVTCRECDSINDASLDACAFCKAPLRDEKRPAPILTVLLLLAAILVISISFVPIRGTEEYLHEELVPYSVEQEVTVSEPVIISRCTLEDYASRREWIGISNEGEEATPYLSVTNLEDFWGVFYVNFSYFDGGRYNYSKYMGREYDSFRHELSRDMADMQSPNLAALLGPGEEHTFSYPARKKVPGSTYWALASLEAPKVNRCHDEEAIVNSTRKEDVVKYRKEIKTLSRDIVRPLWRAVLSSPSGKASILAAFAAILITVFIVLFTRHKGK